MHSPLVEALVDALRVLPGIGKKSAQRIAIQLLDSKRDQAMALSKALANACEGVQRCTMCRSLTEAAICHICADTERDHSIVCVVESLSDIAALEAASAYHGLYFVLMGHLSPIDGIGPDEIGIPELLQRLAKPDVKELILATGTTVEGEATAYFIQQQLLDNDITVSRIAHGVPIGGDLDYVDGGTLAHAIQGRKNLA